MYREFYNLAERPFELTPDARYVYLSAHHREALAHLKYGVEERKGFIQLTGEVGTGKTTMLDVLISELDASTTIAKLSYTTIDELDLLRLLARGFGIEGEASSKAMILNLLSERLSTWSTEGRNAAFVVDEAQNLSLPVLEEIRLLSNLRANGRLSLQIILAGQPELREKLDATELRQLRQRIGVRYHLTPLSRQETGEYVAHRMAVAGSQERVFDAAAIGAIYDYSQGVPRVINMVCDRALLAGYAENRRRVTSDLVLRAIDGLEGVAPGGPPTPEKRASADESPATGRAKRRGGRSRVRWAAPLVAALAVVAISVSAVFYFEGREGAPLSPGEEALAAHEDAIDTLAAGEMSTATVARPDVDLEDTAQPEPRDADAVDAAFTSESAVHTDETVQWERRDEGAAADVDESADERAATDRLETAGAPIETDVADRRYVIVTASSRSRDAALRQVEALAADGMAASVWTVDLGERGLWHRIVLDAGFDSLATAKTAAEYFRDMGHADAWVTRK